MNGALLRKELRDLLPWGILAVALGLSEILGHLTYQVDMLPLAATAHLLNDVHSVLYWLLAFAIGTGLSTREHDDKTLTFLDGLPVSRTRVFVVKCAVIGALVLLAPVMRFAAAGIMHLLSRGSLDHELHALLILKGFALQALLVINGLMLGAALGRLRSLTWLVAGVTAAALVVLADRVPRAAVLNPLALLDWQWAGASLRVDAEAIVVQIAVTGAALLIAWRGFTAAGRFRSPDTTSRPVVGALITIATIGVGVGLFVMVMERAPEAAGSAVPGGAPAFRFSESPPAQTVTRHYRFSYPAHEAAAALALADEADEIFERVHALLGVPLGASIDVDASGSARNTHGTAFLDRVRMALASDVRPVLAHETAHVVAQRIAGGASGWLWTAADVLNEGLASWVEAQFRAPSARAEERMLVLAAMHARRELLMEELANPAVLGMVRDENVKYAAGEAFIAALIRVYGAAALPRLLETFADPSLPTDLGGLPLWQATFQLAGMDLAAVIDEFYAEVAAYARRHADGIAALPRPRVRLVRFGSALGAQALLDVPDGEAGAEPSLVLRFKPAPDSPVSLFRTYDAPADGLVWLAQRDVASGRVCMQPGVRVGGEVLFEQLICLPTREAVQLN